jgi:hypothetical protein
LSPRYFSTLFFVCSFDVITLDFFAQTKDLMLVEWAFVLIYVGAFAAYVVFGVRNLNDAARPAIHITGDLTAIHMALALLIPMKNSIWAPLLGLFAFALTCIVLFNFSLRLINRSSFGACCQVAPIRWPCCCLPGAYSFHFYAC